MDNEIFFHACYVAFVFAFLFFGALAFRQVLDDIAVRRLRMGEDRDAFVNGPAVIIPVVLVLLATTAAVVCYDDPEPTVYLYALPLILGVQGIQMGFRLWFQRMQIKTRGIVVRSMLLERVRPISFDDIGGVTFVPVGPWVEVSFAVISGDDVVFRIFRPSASTLERLLVTSCHVPIRWADRPSNNRNRLPPS